MSAEEMLKQMYQNLVDLKEVIEDGNCIFNSDDMIEFAESLATHRLAAMEKGYSIKEILSALDGCDHLDDAKMYFSTRPESS